MKSLVNRRNLHSKAALRIAEFVAASLLQTLAQRQDLDPATVASLGHAMRETLRRRRRRPRRSRRTAVFNAEVMRAGGSGRCDRSGESWPDREASALQRRTKAPRR